ncbi:MAG: hypothetical protein LBK73_06095 [Treponema sp.]|nr:hypothetical protein [Treponema sp.]
MRKSFYGIAKPLLMKKYIKEIMQLRKGEIFIQNDFINGFSKVYPLFKQSSIKMTLNRLTINRKRTRVTGELDESDDVLWKIDGHTYRLYDKTTDIIS